MGTYKENKAVFAPVLHYFREIAKIPRDSGNEEAISAYVEAFARERGYFCRRDEANNVFIRREAAPGYAEHAPVVLQGHMDMVCEANADVQHDFLHDPIEILENGDILTANGTTLGADDGVAVAMMLALLDKSDLAAPAIECIFTTDEETGMSGMRAFDPSVVTGRRMINLDSAGEGEATVACAGGVRTLLTCKPDRVPLTDTESVWKLEITGLAGGHSGEDIHLGRVMAAMAMARIASVLDEKCGIRLVRIDGGSKDNAIMRECTMVFAASAEKDTTLRDTFANIRDTIMGELVEADRGCAITMTAASDEWQPMTKASSDRVLYLLRSLPVGVREMSRQIPGLVETSANCGIVRTSLETVEITVSSRSSVESKLDDMEDRLRALGILAGVAVEHWNRYPGWAFRDGSALQSVYLDTWKTLFDRDARVLGIHAGLECGLFIEKVPDMDIISIGPDVRNLHCPDELVTISSMERLYALVLTMLEKL